MFQKKKSTKELVRGGQAGLPDEELTPEAGKKKKAKKKKEPGERATAKEFLKSKMFLGILSIAASMLLAFVVAPMLQMRTASLAPVVVLRQDVDVGTQLTAEMLEIVEIGAAGIPYGALSDVSEASGKYVATEGLSGDILTDARLTEEYPTDDPELLDLPEGRVAMAVALDGLEQSVASKLRSGDVIQLFAVLDDSTEEGGDMVAMMIPELQAVEVLDVTNSNASDVADQKGELDGETDDDRQISAVVVAVNQQQAAALAGLSANTKLHAALVVRGDAVVKADLLAAQESYFVTAEETIGDPEDTEPPGQEEAVEEGAGETA